MIKSSKRRSLLFFLSSLLLHCILLLLVMMHTFKRANLTDLPDEKDRVYDTRVLFDEPAELKPRKGELKQQEAEDEQERGPSITSETFPEKQQHITDEMPLIKKEPLTKGAILENEIEVEETQEAQTPTLSRQELKQFALANLFKKLLPQEDVQQKKQSHRTLVPPTAHPLSGQLKRMSISIPMGMNGIRENMGDDLMFRTGDPTKQPSPEELKHILYIRKIASLLHQTLSFLARSFFKGTIEITFDFDEKGYITSSETTGTTPFKDLERKALKALKKISPLPPIPNHWNCSSIMPTITLHWKVEHGMPALYGLYSFQTFQKLSTPTSP